MEPLAVTYWISVVNEKWDICYYADLLEGLSYTLCAVSFFTLDRLRFTFTANGKRQTQVENFSE